MSVTQNTSCNFFSYDTVIPLLVIETKEVTTYIHTKDVYTNT
jgi:hypothetical protein